MPELALRATIRIRNDDMITARNRRGWSQAESATKANVSLGLVVRLEALIYPKKMDTDKVLRLAVALELSPDKIMPPDLAGEAIPNKCVLKKKIDTAKLLAYKDVGEQRLLLGSPDAILQKEETRTIIKHFLDKLSFREQEVLNLRYGLSDGYCHSLREVARISKITAERVRQVEAKALRRLQEGSLREAV